MRTLLYPLIIIAASIAGSANAASYTAALSVSVTPHLIVLTPPTPALLCAAAPGTVVATLSMSDGSAATWSIAGDTTDFILNGNNIVVAAGGISAGGCGRLDSLTITATQ